MHERRALPLACFLNLVIAGCSPPVDKVTTEPTANAVGQPTPAPATETPGSLSLRIEAALKNVRERDLLTTNSFWTIFHGILGSGPEVTLLDAQTQQRVNAIDYICRGGEVRGLKFIPTADGVDVQTGPLFVGQGHQDQFIAEMAQWGMPLERKFRIGGKDYTFADFVQHSQMRTRVTARQELSWAILIIAQYRRTDLEWTNGIGEKLRFDDVVRYELDQPIDEAACGGTHRLFGLTWAYHLHRQRGGDATGVWSEVAAKIEKYQSIARKYQNADGSFSTRYFAAQENGPDPQLRIGTTGHVLEWLALALSDDELRQAWVQDAANALCLMILDSSDRPIDSGALFHAAHGLHLYHTRLFGRSQLTPRELEIPLPPRR